MNATGAITMTMREVDRLKVIEAVAECRLKPGQAAERLDLSVRQIERLVLRYRAAGVAGLVSGKRGRPSNHQLPAGKAQRALALIRERYAGFGPTLVRRLPAKASRSLAERCTNSMSTRSVQTQVRPKAVWNGPI